MDIGLEVVRQQRLWSYGTRCVRCFQRKDGMLVGLNNSDKEN